MDVLQLLQNLVIVGLAYWFWNACLTREARQTKVEKAPVLPLHVGGPKLLKRIEECAERMDQQDLEFLSRQLAHPDNEVALHTARCLAKSMNPAASQLMFEHVERLDREILKHQALRRLERQDFYEKLAESQVQTTAPTRKPKQDWVSESLSGDNFSVLRSYLPTMRLEPSFEELREAILRLLDNSQEAASLKYHALVSLKECPDPPPLPLIEKYLKSHEPLLKRASLDLIGHFQLYTFIPRVELELLNFHPAVATEAVYTLVALQSKSSVMRMRLIEHHRNRLIREAAIWGINALASSDGKQPNRQHKPTGT